MRGMAWMVLAAGLPVAALAQDAVIRIEAKRGGDAARQAAEGWGAQFQDVVTFALPGGWTAIALGPQSPEEAAARLTQLKAEGKVPADSFVAVPGAGVVLSPTAEAEVTAAPEAAPVAEEAPQPAEQPAVPAPLPGTHIRLESFQSQSEAEAALTKWRETFAEAGLWHLPGGWYAVTVGPMEAQTARAWLAAFKAGGVLPKDAFTAETAELGDQVQAGAAPDLPASGAPEEMPPLMDVQKALRWAGHYDGDIDGKPGPKTTAAIDAEIATLRLSPDPGTAMRLLIERRADWRDQMGLVTLEDDYTGLAVTAPMDKLQFDRSERALAIYGPKDDSGAALILFSQRGGQQELLDLSGLVTALGWVPQPERTIENGHVLLDGQNSDHHGRAEGWVRDGRAEGYVLIWPAGDAENQQRIAAEISDSLTRTAPAENEQPAIEGAPVQP